MKLLKTHHYMTNLLGYKCRLLSISTARPLRHIVCRQIAKIFTSPEPHVIDKQVNPGR